ncbi:MAG: shikimate kinase [Desulfobacteraceae bacterium]
MIPTSVQTNDARRSNVILIGMPGVGKSTVGVLLAKELGLSFLDTDLGIQAAQGRSLQAIIDREGVARFREIEERCVLALTCRRHVIATGGSVVYSPRAMAHLGAMGAIVLLELDAEGLMLRLGNLQTRGVLRAPGQTIAELCSERRPLYRRYAHLRIDCRDQTPDALVARIVARLPGPGPAPPG